MVLDSPVARRRRFFMAFLCVCVIGIAVVHFKIAHTTTSKQGNPALALAQGGTGARITAQSEEGRGGGCSQGSSELDSERRRVQCALQGKAMDRHIPPSSGSSWLTASSMMPLSFLSRSYHRVDLLRVNIGNAIMDLVNSNERRRCHD